MRHSVPTLGTRERDKLRRALERKLERLGRAGQRDLSTAIHPEEAYPDVMDAATRATDENELFARADHARALARDIEHALDKLARGVYGLSELSGEPIPLARLRAIPWARLTEQEERSMSSGRGA
jgi:DnaK suppressor protein